MVLSATVLGMALSSSGRAALASEPVSQADIEAGRQIYLDRCALCHGTEGDGAGPAADVLKPRPRDFRQGLFKIRTTPSGEIPTDGDLLRVIAEGMPGSSMPGWKAVLSEAQRRQVAAYVRTFDQFYDPEYVPEVVTAARRAGGDAESIARGRQLYRELECYKCHGDNGRGNGPSAFDLQDEWGFPILPADLTQNWTFRGGGEVEDIYMRFSTGMNGTPMPAFAADVINDEDRWHLAHFVRSLSPPRRPEVKAAIEAIEAVGELPVEPGDEAWARASQFYFPLAGQVMVAPRWFTPSVTSLFVQALYNEREIALRLTWNDRTEERGESGPPDAAAVQFPASVPPTAEKPYFFMGDARHPVTRWQWEAAENRVRELSATGAGTEAPRARQSLTGRATFEDGRWQLVLRRPLVTGDPDDIRFERGKFIPIAFTVADGRNGESGTRVAVTPWYYLYLQKPRPTSAYGWVAGAMLAVIAAEWGLLRVARRRSANG